jgi:hypothetical protein
MKTISVLGWSIGLLLANMTLWLIVLALYLSQHPEVIQYNVGVA